MIDPLYVASGFGVGLLVGMTGVGGGSLLLVGSLPGIVIGSYCARRVPETALRLVLAVTLILVAGNLASHELHSSSSIIAAFAPSAAH
jgi:uncharacterized protein